VIGRVAYLSIHTSPLEVPGVGDAGGMNVYVHHLATAMARRGVRADVFTRRIDPAAPEEVEVEPGYRVINVTAGPPEAVPTAALADVVGTFAEGVAAWAIRHRAVYDVIHSHYWLSGWAGLLLHEVLRVPLAISFHTLGRVKDANRRADQASASLLRIAAEEEVIARAGCVVASTPAEAAELIEHYAARPERLCVSPPGVDHDVFFPGDRLRAREVLGLPAGRLLLFVARIQPLKGGDVALAAFAELAPDLPDLRLAVVGGPSGPQGLDEESRLHADATAPEVMPIAALMHWCCRPAASRSAWWPWRHRPADCRLWPPESEAWPTRLPTASPGSWWKAGIPRTTPQRCAPSSPTRPRRADWLQGRWLMPPGTRGSRLPTGSSSSMPALPAGDCGRISGLKASRERNLRVSSLQALCTRVCGLLWILWIPGPRSSGWG
jgi:hypothetical protein